MVKRNFSLPFLILVFLHAPVSAALYQITVEGTVISAVYSNVAVGDPFTIRYTADSTDLEPAPTIARFEVVQKAVAILPHATLTSPPYDDIDLSLNNNARRDDYGAYNGWTANGPFQILFTFPAGTLVSDALPLSLPIEQATFAQWNYGGDLGESLIGAVTAYDAVEVPEPKPEGVVALPLAVMTVVRSLGRAMKAG